MSWLGKILAVLVMVLGVAGMWLTASAFAVRTNWRTSALLNKDALKDANAARESEYRTNQAERDALARQVKSGLAREDQLVAMIDKLKTENGKNLADIASLKKQFDSLTAKGDELQALLTAAQSAADKLQQRVGSLEDEKIKLTVTTEQAVKDKQAAETLAKQAQSEKLNADRKLEETLAALAEAKANGGGTASGNNLYREKTAPVPEGARGTVELYQEGRAVINLGIDHGITKGATLDVFRTGAQAKYLGTLVIDIAQPQTAVGTFRPADPRRSLRSLRPDELPTKGDRVGRVGSIGATP